MPQLYRWGFLLVSDRQGGCGERPVPLQSEMRLTGAVPFDLIAAVVTIALIAFVVTWQSAACA
ncbi:hypothetical protein [Stenomitos frigidus]|uniref:Uncharacterized protein n=1 Tax=Stenomitos frigidus ULC18 TaxID=2107698 RepID=A0A2T1DT05_9CYAN|nr:hypothetical protein [Stenomitos frigidus]PSB23605.1 hypothetical protein C7B82_30460 [Stenomitos frigidus ULC18]